jgi:lipopolysaccharide/colanic/teichoic acid biosynthesis glycosyltransferase
MSTVGDLLRRRPSARRLTATVAPSPEARPHEGETLAERYSRMAHEGHEPGLVDVVLRGLDVAIGAVVLALVSPVMAVVAVAIRIDSGGPVLYRGLRVGRAGRVFTMFKFRTLSADAESRLGPFLGEELTRLTQDETTRVGGLLRASHLDELPQLFNVIAGDMSLVGPRPIRPAFFEQLCERVPQYWQRLVVAPGMTGFAQLRMTREMTWEEKLAHDLEYIADRSPRLYVKVVLDTLAALPARIRGGA